MPRNPRVFSNTGYYHIVFRGIGKQILFEDTADYRHYLHTLRRFQQENSFELIAYCLMENHIHLLVHVESDLDKAMKQISVSYAYYFNMKYDRSGHLFQDRFLSEPIEDDRYLLAVVRYIHNNPVKAGICRRDEYLWSSWHEYVGSGDLVSPALVLDLVGGIDGFLQFSTNDASDEHLDISEKRRLSDAQAIRVIRNELHLQSGTLLQKMSRADRDRALHVLKENGLSLRQIERLTGINRGVVLKA